MSTKIGVIESRWHHPENNIRRNTTVKPLFDFLSDLHYGSHHGYDYEMVNTRGSFASALKNIAESQTTTIAYLAMHGNENELNLHGGDTISRTFLKNILIKITQNDRSNLTGLYFGSCLFGSQELAEYLFGHDTSVTWISGYQENIDFVASSGFDLLFFNTLIAVREEKTFDINRNVWKKKYSTKRSIIEEVARRIRGQMQGLCNTPSENGGNESLGLGFSIYVRKRGNNPGVQDLLRVPRSPPSPDGQQQG